MPPDHETENKILGGLVRLLQPGKGYRTAIDPVFLSAALSGEISGTLLDVGCGTGAVMLCLLARARTLNKVTGLEIHADHAAMARKNLALNGWETRGTIIEGTINVPPCSLPANSFDFVVTNPPYHPTGTLSASEGRNIAHRDTDGLSVWLGFCLRMLKPGGRLALIHRADRLDEILANLRPKSGSIDVIPLWPKAGIAAKRVVVRAIKGSRGSLTLSPGLILHHRNGRYTSEAETILRDGNTLDNAIAGQFP